MFWETKLQYISNEARDKVGNIKFLYIASLVIIIIIFNSTFAYFSLSWI